MLTAVVVEQAWDPATIEVDPTGQVDWSRAVAGPSPGSLEVVEIGLSLGEVEAFGLGLNGAAQVLRTCLAMGSKVVASAPDAYAVAEALRGERCDLVLVPHRSEDHGASPLGPLLAGLLDLPQATAVETLRVEGAEAVVTCRRDRGERVVLALPLPAVVALEPGLVRPREASPAMLVAVQAAELPTLPPAPNAPRLIRLGHLPPRPAAPRLAAPDASLPAEARIAAVVGTAPDGRQRDVVSGSPDEVAGRIVRLLKERGYV